jgi:hypothetical protein
MVHNFQIDWVKRTKQNVSINPKSAPYGKSLWPKKTPPATNKQLACQEKTQQYNTTKQIKKEPFLP